MISVKQKEIESVILLANILYKHINNCNDIDCSCNLLKTILKEENSDKIKNEELQNYMSQILPILNYLFESSFIEKEFYKSFEPGILLAEHYCYLKDNPIMAFSFITTLILKHRNKFSRIQLTILYELCQKYIYCLTANIINEKELEVLKGNNTKIFLMNQREKEFNNYYANLRMSYKAKGAIYNYINNLINVLKYKIIFEDSLLFQYDENNDYIISAKINFFDKSIQINNFYNNSKHNKNINANSKKDNQTNLYYVIDLLKKNQFYFKIIFDFINKMDETKGVPIFILFKYLLCFDIFDGGKIPEKIFKKLYSSMGNNRSPNNSFITNKEYEMLKKKYNEQNNKIDSKIFIIIEFKKELRIKYFSEDGALKLGFSQKEIINEPIEILMPKAFGPPHQKAIKQLIISDQIKYYVSEKTFLFNKNSTVLYSTKFETSLIFNVSKNITLMLKSQFRLENEYRFMLDNKFELLANSNNFENEYYLNQKIFHMYNINFLDLLKIKPEKINQKFANEHKNIQHQKLIRQIKTEEYFISQMYTNLGGNSLGLINPSLFNTAKNNIIAKISHLNNNKKEYLVDSKENNDNEENELLHKDTFQSHIFNLFDNKDKPFSHKYYNFTFNKGKFIENLAKELIKIPDNDLMMEKDNFNYNLILSAKKHISKLLGKKELNNHFLKITIKYSFYFDKSFYFITINDQKKLYLNISKGINFQNNNKLMVKTKTNVNEKNKIPFRNLYKKSRNKGIAKKNKDNLNTKKMPNIEKKDLRSNSIDPHSGISFFNEINEYRVKINRDKFILIIKITLTLIIILILLIYIISVFHQIKLISIQDKILIAYCYNYNSRDLILNIHSELLQIFFQNYGFHENTISTREHYQEVLYNLTNSFKDYYHEFINYYKEYNLYINKKSDLLYKKTQFKRLLGFWKENEYYSMIYSELDFIIYYIYKIDLISEVTEEMRQDLNNFIFFKYGGERVNTYYIKILYYLSINYEFSFKDLFTEFEKEIYESYKEYISSNTINYILLEIIGVILFILFFLNVFFYLYFSNQIIIKNVIFLFLDFNEKNQRNKTNNNIISLKLLQFQRLIDDFDMNNFEKYTKNVDNVNKKKFDIPISDDIKKIFNIKIETKTEPDYASLSQTGRTSYNGNEYDSKKTYSKRKKDTQKLPSKRSVENLFSNSKLSSNKNLKNIDNSSYNNLVESFSQFFKEKLNQKNINASNEFLTDKNNSNNVSNHNMSISMNKSSKQNINDLNNIKTVNDDNLKDLLLNSSNRNIVLIIKIFLVITSILIIGLIIFNIYKLCYSLDFNSSFNSFFDDFTILTHRYSMLFYYYNTLRVMFIFPPGEKKKILEESMEKMSEVYEEENRKFSRILSSNINNYFEIKELFNVIIDSRNNMTDIIRKEICSNKVGCENYLDSEYNIFSSGIDLALKTCMTQMNNIYMDYKNLVDKTDTHAINDSIIHNPHFKFVYIGNSINNMFLYVKDKIFECFKNDEDKFNNSYNESMIIFNSISIILSIFLSLFILIYIFISISRFIEPIKESTYRINCSFYNIRRYSLTNHRKLESEMTNNK